MKTTNTARAGPEARLLPFARVARGRIGVHGPYLDRQYPFFFPGEAKPGDLPATGYGLDVEWGAGHWNVWGELQHFQMDYRVIPNFTQHGICPGATDAESALVCRGPTLDTSGSGVVPDRRATNSPRFRPNAHQLVKFGYTIQQGAAYPGTLGNTAAIEFVTTFRALSLAAN